MIKIRKGNVEDLKDIIVVNKKTWKTTYNGIIDTEFLKKVSLEATPEEIKNRAEQIQNNKAQYIVAEDDKKIIGMLKLIKAPNKEYGEIPEVQALYILKEYQKNGVGSKLIDEAKEMLRNEKYSKMQIGCIDGNPSNEFYKKIGGKFAVQRMFELEGKNYNENVYIFDI